jgi:hypothetical protein
MEIRRNTPILVPVAGRAQGKQSLDFGCEQNGAIHHCVKQRLDAETVARRDQAAAAFLGDDDGEFSAQVMDEFGAVFLVKMKRDLAIGVGCEPPPSAASWVRMAL